MADKGQIRAVDVSGCFWHDVDTPEALEAGKELLLTRLKTAKQIDGPIFSVALTLGFR